MHVSEKKLGCQKKIHPISPTSPTLHVRHRNPVRKSRIPIEIFQQPIHTNHRLLNWQNQLSFSPDVHCCGIFVLLFYSTELSLFVLQRENDVKPILYFFHTVIHCSVAFIVTRTGPDAGFLLENLVAAFTTDRRPHTENTEANAA